MDLALTARRQAFSASSFGTGGYSPAAFTPSANSLLVVGVVAKAGDVGDFSANLTVADDQSGVYTQRAVVSATPVANDHAAAIWTCPIGASPASTTLTFDCGATSVDKYGIFAVDLTNYNTSSPVGGKMQDSSIAEGADSGTLDATPATDSVVIALLGRNINPGATSVVTHGTGWTEVYDAQQGTDLDLCLQLQHRTGSTSTTVGWDDTEASGATYQFGYALAVEIKVAASSVGSLGGLAGKGFLAGRGGLAGIGGGLAGFVKIGNIFRPKRWLWAPQGA